MIINRNYNSFFKVFPVTKYGGTKSLVISTVSILGGKNPFLGWAYIVVRAICVVLGCNLRHYYIKNCANFSNSIIFFL